MQPAINTWLTAESRLKVAATFAGAFAQQALAVNVLQSASVLSLGLPTASLLAASLSLASLHFIGERVTPSGAVRMPAIGYAVLAAAALAVVRLLL